MYIRSLKTYAIAVIATLIAAIAIILTDTLKVNAEEQTVSAVPVLTGEVTYGYFRSPASVYSDDAGLIIAGDSLYFTPHKGDGRDYAITKKELSSPVEKAIRFNNETLITLGGGAVYCEDVPLSALSFYAIDMALGKTGKLYILGENKLAAATVAGGALTLDGEYALGGISASHITVCENKIYVSHTSDFGELTDISRIDLPDDPSEPAGIKRMLDQTDSVLALCAADYNSTVYVLTRSELTAYTAANRFIRSVPPADGSKFIDICAHLGNVYALSSLNAVYKISADLKNVSEEIASASSAYGFFNKPIGVALKNSTLYVADCRNDRVAIYGDELTYRQFDRPVSVAAATDGSFYVANGSGKVFTCNGDETTQFTVADDGTPQEILRLEVDSHDVLYILTSERLWVYDGELKPLGGKTAYDSIALGVGKEELYAMNGTEIVRFNGDTPEKVCDILNGTVAFDVDIDGNVFMLRGTDGKTVISRRATTGTDADVDVVLDRGGEILRGELKIGTIENSAIGPGIHYGDIMITDTDRHRTLTVSGETLGVKMIDDVYDDAEELAVSTDPTEYTDDGTRLIRKALSDISVYSKPRETDAIYTIEKDRLVIVPEYEVSSAKGYAHILIENSVTGALVEGYVLNHRLSDPAEPYSMKGIPYGALSDEQRPTATVAYFNSSIRKWPSREAKPIRGLDEIEQGKTFEILSFVPYYRDIYGDIWYRVLVDADGKACEGFISNNSIVLNGFFKPENIRPAYDAVIVEYNGSDEAVVYDDAFNPVTGIKLKAGTRVEIVGTFDSSEQYTKVKFLDETLSKSAEGYVLTVYIEYEGFNMVPLVALIVIIVTVALSIVITVAVVYYKSKRPAVPRDTQGSDAE